MFVPAIPYHAICILIVSNVQEHGQPGDWWRIGGFPVPVHLPFQKFRGQRQVGLFQPVECFLEQGLLGKQNVMQFYIPVPHPFPDLQIGVQFFHQGFQPAYVHLDTAFIVELHVPTLPEPEP